MGEDNLAGVGGTPGVAKRPWFELGLMADPILDQVLLYYLGSVRQGFADIGECLDTASRIDPNDEYSWSREWRKTADRLRQVAEGSEARDHRLSAGESYLKAATYYRAASHRYPEPGDPDVKELATRAVASFNRALDLLPIPVQAVEIPYENSTLPGYFFRSPRASANAPILIVHQGRDAWAEDCLYLAEAAIQRGYHALLFDGPGQGKVLRLRGLAFRPDWERVISPVVDFAVNTPGVDANRIAIMGLSMGGSLIIRAAAFERRPKIVIANPGVYRWNDVIEGFFAQIDPGLPRLAESDPAAFNSQIEQLMRMSPLLRWGVKDTLWKHGATSPAEVLRMMKDYTNAGIVDRITSHVLVMDGTADEWAQGRELYDALKCPKDYLLFTEEDTGLAHCQTGALSVAKQRLFDWLDENI